MRLKDINGIWLYGLAGSGKTYASSIIANHKANAFIIDGDNVREKISTDLGYKREDRLTQIERLLGIGKLALDNDCFPIISSVYMSEDIYRRCIECEIKVLRIDREKEQIMQHREFYKNEINVVGQDLELPLINTDVMRNNGDESFTKSLIQYVN